MSLSGLVGNNGIVFAIQRYLVASTIFLGLCANGIYAQTPKKKLGGGLSLPTSSQIFASVNAVEDYMVLLSNYTNSGEYELMYSLRTGMDDWDRATPIPNLHRFRLDHMGSYCLSHDGRYLLFSSVRSGGVGKYDIWISERRSTGWSQPQNPGKPVNTSGYEGNPSLSPDGNTLYFMRCEKMSVNEKSGCRLYRSHRRAGNRWSEPEELPFNSGHDTSPRILIDNRTLIFASNRAGGRGGMDLYMTREEEYGWSEPVPLDFLNTARNDEYVSVPAKGDIVYYTDRDRDQYQIFKAIIPESMRPDPVLLLSGTTSFSGSGTPASGSVIQVSDAESGRVLVQSQTAPGKGDFFLALRRGHVYDVLFAPPEAGYAFHIEKYDLRFLEKPLWEQPAIELPKLNPGLIIDLPALKFETGLEALPANADRELGKIARLLQMNPSLKLELIMKPVEGQQISGDDSRLVAAEAERENRDDKTGLVVDNNEIIENTSNWAEQAPANSEHLCMRRAMAVLSYLRERGMPEGRIILPSGNHETAHSDCQVHFAVVE